MKPDKISISNLFNKCTVKDISNELPLITTFNNYSNNTIAANDKYYSIFVDNKNNIYLLNNDDFNESISIRKNGYHYNILDSESCICIYNSKSTNIRNIGDIKSIYCMKDNDHCNCNILILNKKGELYNMFMFISNNLPFIKENIQININFIDSMISEIIPFHRMGLRKESVLIIYLNWSFEMIHSFKIKITKDIGLELPCINDIIMNVYNDKKCKYISLLEYISTEMFQVEAIFQTKEKLCFLIKSRYNNFQILRNEYLPVGVFTVNKKSNNFEFKGIKNYNIHIKKLVFTDNLFALTYDGIIYKINLKYNYYTELKFTDNIKFKSIYNTDGINPKRTGIKKVSGENSYLYGVDINNKIYDLGDKCSITNRSCSKNRTPSKSLLYTDIIDINDNTDHIYNRNFLDFSYITDYSKNIVFAIQKLVGEDKVYKTIILHNLNIKEK